MVDGFVILVDFTLKPGAVEGFLAAVGRNAAASVKDEPGCRRFDVLTPEANDDHVVLYEIYASREAFAEHLKTAHYAAFKDATEGLVLTSTVGRLDLREHAKGRAEGV